MRAFSLFGGLLLNRGDASIVPFPTKRDNSMNGTGLEHLF